MTRPAIQQWAGHYICNMGLAVVPLLPRSKKCVDDDWPSRTFGIDDFEDGANIGLRSLHGIVVVDDDLPTLAVACMDYWLPASGAVYGRSTRPRAKRLYRCRELTKTVTFKDLNGKDLQIRVGLQDMAPPSVHPDTREQLMWDGRLLPPPEIAKDNLVAAVRNAWASRMLGQWWPSNARHELRLAFARVFLETLSVPDETTVAILEWACRLGGSDSDGIRDVRRAVETTRARLAAQEPAVGGSTVQTLLPDVGRRILQTLRAAFGANLVLDPNDPLRTAREYVARYETTADVRTLQHWQHEFYGYEAGAYREQDSDTVRARLYAFLERARRPGKEDEDDRPFQPTRDKVANVVDALRAVCNLPASEQAPCWLKTPALDVHARDMLACPNGLLHIPTRTLYPASPHFFTLNAIDFPYDSAAPRPEQWFAFLSSLWPDDEHSRDTLQELFGYILTPDTSQQKVFMLVGPPRSGKGITGRVLRCLVGPRNVCSPTLASFGRDFGKQVLVGKTVALISDARISGHTDTAVVAEALLSISGEDAQTVPRKFLPDWNGKLGVRFLLLTNELPRLGDVSGALAKRFVVLPLTQSFYGREDMTLFDRLAPELPGILNWALAGRDRLTQRGYFVQPPSADDLMQEFADLGSPEAAFLRQQTRREPGATVSQKALFDAWSMWARENGRDHVGTVQTFGRNVRAVLPWVNVKKLGGRGEQERHWEGLRIEMPGTADRPAWLPGTTGA